MKVTEAIVRKCKNVSTLKDKMLRERRIEYNKFIIMLVEKSGSSSNKLVI